MTFFASKLAPTEGKAISPSMAVVQHVYWNSDKWDPIHKTPANFSPFSGTNLTRRTPDG
ncbi:hypothetical protein METHPM2_170046 [Pseudomonas sp. PM2]